MKHKIIAISTTVLLVLCMLPVTALAVTQDIADGAVVNLDDAAYTAGDTLNIAAGASVTISGTKAVQIICGAGVTLTLSGATIDVSATDNACPLSFTGSGNSLKLAAGTTNTLTAGGFVSAVCVKDTTELTISGTGTLNATGGRQGAGIGSGDSQYAGTITITDSTVNANGSLGGAGIGSGVGGGGGTITINGGTVTAVGAGGGAGIGGGTGGAGAAVNISGGTVSATAGLGYDIGSGSSNSGGGTLSVDGAASLTLGKNGTNASVVIGDAYIKDDSTASPITDGYYVDGSLFGYSVDEIIIDVGGTYSITSGFGLVGTTFTLPESGYTYLLTGSTTERKVAVSSGVTDNVILFGTSIATDFGSALDMTGANVSLELCGSSTLESGSGYAGLQCPDGAAVAISSSTALSDGSNDGVVGSLTATGGSDGAGIGGGNCSNGGNITINSGTVNANGSGEGAGIGGGEGGSGGEILITGGTLKVNGGDLKGTGYSDSGGAGIGGGTNGSGGKVTISGGTLNVTGGRLSAGIGGGAYADGGTINISGGDITAKGGISGKDIGSGAGIGGGLHGNGGNITISGGTIYAEGGADSAGIGGGDRGADLSWAGGDGGTITITGGNITAKGVGMGGAGIGSGRNGSGGNITISGGVVYAAKAWDGVNDIGGDVGGGTLSISGTAAVFMQNDSYITPVTTTTHTHFTDNKSYGFTMPDGWTTFGAWLRLCTISYNTNNGSGTVPDSVTQLYNTTATVADSSGLSRTYYTFSGWNTAADGGGTGYAAGSTFTFTADTTLYAQWTVESYTLNYDLDGGAVSSANPTGYTVESAAITLNNPTKTDYTFAGWTGTGITGDPVLSVTIPAGSTGNREYTAHWTATAYALTYELGGGTASNPTSYTVESNAITLNNPTKTGYTFAGWTGTGITGTSMSVTIPAGSTGDRTYTAHWEAVVISGLPQTYTMYTGGRVTWDPQPEGGTWDWDESFFSATFNSPATFTALKAGTSVISYTADGVTQSVTVTVNESELPQTGQDFTWVWVIAGLAVCSGAAGIVVRKRRISKPLR